MNNGKQQGSPAQTRPGQVWRLTLFSEVLSGWGACDGKQFSKVIVSAELGARMFENDFQLP